jgi:hypothetical protein
VASRVGKESGRDARPTRRRARMRMRSRYGDGVRNCAIFALWIKKVLP